MGLGWVQTCLGHLSLEASVPSPAEGSEAHSREGMGEARAELTSGRTEGSGQLGLHKEEQVPCTSRGDLAPGSSS